MSEEMEDQEIQEKKYAVNDQKSASDILKKIKFLDGEIERIKQQAKEERADVDEWEEKELKSLSGKRDYFAGVIRYYYTEQKHLNSKFKLTSPWGKVNSSTRKSLVVEDEQGLMEYLELNDEQAIKVKKEINKSYINSRYKNGVNPDTGEIIPGITVEEKETFSITTKTKEQE
ncbi:hypothetical protein B0H39_004637 [Clostridium beijerinckii]|uniref:host-nuclease inhibitor Gam family protein n=1 Tax=Clostridium beijerinckii TaxID=1520 RepID=UPI001493FB5F|nr:host-nuclease inhibitor Gam family protein [Clostridium beijerinckii]NOW86756.1 hypothetical protein [Clostridium beijerinckii]